jgi:hypothetical protein
MSAFSIQQSLQRAEQRLLPRQRRRRSDAGASRLAEPVERRLKSLLLTRERPSIRNVMLEIAASCKLENMPVPSRATIYNLIERLEAPVYLKSSLPRAVANALYNVADETLVPGHQVAFHAFNYGDTAALCFAAGMPWICLRKAARLRGWRPKSRGLLEAVMQYRGI